MVRLEPRRWWRGARRPRWWRQRPLRALRTESQIIHEVFQVLTLATTTEGWVERHHHLILTVHLLAFEVVVSVLVISVIIVFLGLEIFVGVLVVITPLLPNINISFEIVLVRAKIILIIKVNVYFFALSSGRRRTR